MRCNRNNKMMKYKSGKERILDIIQIDIGII